MDNNITFDFAFIQDSLLHGEFLCEVHRSCPGIGIQRVNHLHQEKPNIIFLSVSMPDDVGTLLKLRFGQCLVERRPQTSPYDDFLNRCKEEWLSHSYKKKMENPIDHKYKLLAKKIRYNPESLDLGEDVKWTDYLWIHHKDNE